MFNRVNFSAIGASLVVFYLSLLVPGSASAQVVSITTTATNLNESVARITDDAGIACKISSGDLSGLPNPEAGNECAAAAEFTITVTGTTTSAVTVTYGVMATDLNPAQPTDFGASVFPTRLTSIVLSGTNVTKTAGLNIYDDLLAEGVESFKVVLTGASGGATEVSDSQNTITFTIAASDLSAGDVSIMGPATRVNEGEAASFTVTAHGNITEPVTVSYDVAAAAANSAQPADLTDGATTFITGQTVIIGIGTDQTATIAIATFDDTLAEADEVFTVTLTGAGGGATMLSGLRSATATIAGNDPSVSITGPVDGVVEGDLGDSYGADNIAVFTVTAKGPTTSPVTVTYSIATGTVGDGAEPSDLGQRTTNDGLVQVFDMLPMTGQTIEIEAGLDRTATISIYAMHDNLSEPAESFMLSLTGAGGGTTVVDSAEDSAIAVIEASDRPALRFSAPNRVDEGERIPITLILSAADSLTDPEVTLRITTTAERGIQPEDLLVSQNGLPLDSLPFNTTARLVKNGQTTVFVATNDDTLSESPEQLSITMASASTGITLGHTTVVTTTIADNDQRVSITGPAADVTEGDTAVFTVTVAGTTTDIVTVTYNIGAASVGGIQADDLGLGSGFPGPRTLEIAAGENQTATINIATLNDNLAEADEAFTVTLTGASGGATEISNLAGVSTATIAANDLRDGSPPPTASITGPGRLLEGNQAIFTVTVAGTTTSAVTVSYAIAATAMNGAQSGDIGRPSGSLFLPFANFFEGDGQIEVPAGTNQTATISHLWIRDDATPEAAESFMITLTDASGGTTAIDNTPAIVTIAANDLSGVSITGPAAVVREGDEAIFTVTANGRITGPVTVTYGVAAAAMNIAQAADLRDGFTSGRTVEIAPAVVDGGTLATDRTAVIRIPIVDDSDTEPAESFVVTLTSAGGGITMVSDAANSATATIASSDQGVAIVGPSTRLGEGDTATFTVSVDSIMTGTVTVTYDVTAANINGAAFSDLGNRDNSAALAAFPTGQTVRLTATGGSGSIGLISIPIFDDTVTENSEEAFVVTLTGASGGTTLIDSSRRRATATIRPSDQNVVSVAGPATNVSEGGAAIFTVTAHGTTTSNVTVTYSVSGSGSAPAEAADFGSGGFPGGTVTIIAGENQMATITIAVFNDTTTEAAESFAVTLTSASGGATRISPVADSDTATIMANDQVVSVSGPARYIGEGRKARFKVTVTGTTTSPVTVTYDLAATMDNGAQAADLSDGAAPPMALSTFPMNQKVVVAAGATKQSTIIRIPIFDDTMIEEDAESFMMTLTGASGGATQLSSTESSATATIAPSDSTFVYLNGPGVVSEGETAEYTVTVTGTTADPVTVTYSIAATADNGAEFEDLGNSDNSAALGAFPTNETIAVTAGRDRTATIRVPIFDDSTAELAESFTVTLTGAMRNSGSVTVSSNINTITSTISTNDLTGVSITEISAARSATITTDPRTGVFIFRPTGINELPSDPTFNEGDTAIFTVTAHGETTEPVTVTYSIAATPTNGAQFTDLGNRGNTAPLGAFPTNATIEIATGEDQSGFIRVPIFDDAINEATAESFTVTLTGASGGTSELSSLLANTATATISASDAGEGAAAECGGVSPTDTTGRHADCELLLSVKDTLDTVDPSILNWERSRPIAQWDGVVIPAGGRVTSLRLAEMRLAGQIPPELSSLSGLTGLSLRNNSLTGSIPAELGSLSNLSTLNLDGNRLSGAIPPTLGGLSNLTLLQLDRNSLSGAIPSALGNLSNLRSLLLFNNQLSGTIPTTLGNLRSSLVGLRLDGNQLSGSIPAELGNLENLRTIILSGNRLTGCIPLRVSALSVSVLAMSGTFSIASQTGGTLLDCLRAPENLRATLSNEQVILNWDRVANAAGYQVCYQEGSAAPTCVAIAGTLITHTFSGLTNGTEYTFSIRTGRQGGGVIGYGLAAEIMATPVRTVFSISGTPTVNEGGSLSFSVVGSGLAPTTNIMATCTVSGSEVTAGDFRDNSGATSASTNFPTASLIFDSTNHTTPQSCVIYTYDDAEQEGAENLTMTLTTSSGGGVQTATATGIINASDRTFSIAAPSPANAAEGSSLTYTVSLAGAALTETATITYSLSGTGITTDDFATTAGGNTAIRSLTGNTVEMMAMDASSANLVLHLHSDDLTEGVENFTVTLTGISGGGGDTNHISGAAGSARGIIDPRFMASVDDNNIVDGDDGLIMYQVYTLSSAGVTPNQRRAANDWRRIGMAAGGDLNSDGDIDGDDALILYMVDNFEELLRDHPGIQTILLGDLVDGTPSNADYRELLRRTNQLLEVNRP